ncbi:MAG: uncharacterized protein QOJ84_1946 [Bradyrhizobium sp.]|jgi:hypothetical protein|nr:uncharacterized protein [Bradyrhizobium sp.]
MRSQPTIKEATSPDAVRARGLIRLLMAIQPRCPEKIWLSGGTLRDILVGSGVSESSDVDLLFFNEKETSKNYEIDLQAELVELTDIRNLSVKNQARMGLVVDGVKYENLLQSVAAFPDVTIAVAACVHDPNNQTTLVFAPYGLPSEDRALIQPTSRYLAAHQLGDYYAWLDRKKYEQRLRNWTIDTAAREPLASSSAFMVC